MTTWKSFCARRGINPRSYVERNGLSTRELFLSKMRELGLELPTESELDGLYPVPPADLELPPPAAQAAPAAPVTKSKKNYQPS